MGGLKFRGGRFDRRFEYWSYFLLLVCIGIRLGLVGFNFWILDWWEGSGVRWINFVGCKVDFSGWWLG